MAGKPQAAIRERFIQAWDDCAGSPIEVSRRLGMTIRAVYGMRKRLAKEGVVLVTVPLHPSGMEHGWQRPAQFERWRLHQVDNGHVVIFTDPHYLPDHSTVPHDALETIIKRLKPVGVICNGDAADGDTISRYDPTRGHHKRFTVREELDCVRDHFDSLDKVIDKNCPKDVWRDWDLGNHDVRLSRFVATRAPELKELPYTRLEDWVPRWPLSWCTIINKDTFGMTVVRHRPQAGMLHLQGTKSGCHYCHGHLHRPNVHTTATFRGAVYSVDAGSLADPKSGGFDYMEGNAEHIPSFAVLTYKNGNLLRPELCQMEHDGRMWFRGAPV